MVSKQNEVNWKWWWQQVLDGIIPESIYRFARLKDKCMRLQGKLNERK